MTLKALVIAYDNKEIVERLEATDREFAKDDYVDEAEMAECYEYDFGNDMYNRMPAVNSSLNGKCYIYSTEDQSLYVVAVTPKNSDKLLSCFPELKENLVDIAEDEYEWYSTPQENRWRR